jgi:hypothetical protein
VRYTCLFEFYSYRFKPCIGIKPGGMGLGVQKNCLVALLNSQYEQLIENLATDTTTTPLLYDRHATYFAGWMESPGAYCVTVFVFDDDMETLVVETVPFDLWWHALLIHEYPVAYRTDGGQIA